MTSTPAEQASLQAPVPDEQDIVPWVSHKNNKRLVYTEMHFEGHTTVLPRKT